VAYLPKLSNHRGCAATLDSPVANRAFADLGGTLSDPQPALLSETITNGSIGVLTHRNHNDSQKFVG
jgi:hypothetical protein